LVHRTKGCLEVLGWVGGCVIEVQKLLVRVETEEWVYEAFELS